MLVCDHCEKRADKCVRVRVAVEVGEGFFREAAVHSQQSLDVCPACRELLLKKVEAAVNAVIRQR